MNDVYIDYCEKHLHRLLSMYDMDTYSKTKGYGDREFWGWKSRDYCNASLQGGVLALSYFVSNGYFKDDTDKIINLIKNIFDACDIISYRNYSVDEIMPFENCFCVSASLTMDLLYSIEFVGEYLNKYEIKKYINLCEKFINFFIQNIESHGVISNHLAAAVAAIYKYEHITGDKKYDCYAYKILKIILNSQSSEGWYKEYEGADPGYQTLCTYYMGIVYELTKSEEVLFSLKKSIKFLSYCIHPDGTIGGEYGSRNTQIYYPAGFELLKQYDQTALSIAAYMRVSIENNDTVTIDNVDQGNFIPYINNYIMAHIFLNSYEEQDKCLLPFRADSFEKYFNDCGLYFVNNKKYYSIVCTKKGGLIKIFNKIDGKLILDDCGYMGLLSNNTNISTQIYDNKGQIQIKNNSIQLINSFYNINSMLPSCFNFIVLRILNMTVMRYKFFNRLIKDILVKLLITKKSKINILLKKSIVFNDDYIQIVDVITNKTRKNFKWLECGEKFSTIHMASSKYFNKHYLLKSRYKQNININELNSKRGIRISYDIEVK